MSMTTDERASACAGDIGVAALTGDAKPTQIIARHIREAVAERDALLLECVEILPRSSALGARITAMIGGKMTPEQRDAEYQRFLEAYPDRVAIPRVCGFAFPQCDGWMRRAEIAIAEREELQAEIERLRGWKESAMSTLSDWNKVWESLGKPGPLGASMAVESRKEVERLRAENVELRATMASVVALDDFPLMPEDVVARGVVTWPTVMTTCPVCQNKRCPKATDAKMRCTNSNELGQVGELESEGG